MPKDNDASNGFVRWKNLITVLLSVIVLVGGIGTYALNAKSEQEHLHTNLAKKEHSHPTLVRFREMEPIRTEIKTVRDDIAELRDEVREVRKMLIEFIATVKG